MNVIGFKVRLLSSRDPTKKGVAGIVMLETANTLLIDAGPKMVTIEKPGSVLMMVSTGKVISGDDLAGRLEDRWGGRAR